MRRPIVNTLFFLSLLITCVTTANAKDRSFPDIIPLPDGFRPEGIVLGVGHEIYAGSLANGSIYQADLRTGKGSILVEPSDDRIAVGMAFDRRSNYLFVAGGLAGAGIGSYMDKQDKLLIIKILKEKGLFLIKGAAKRVSNELNVSLSTIYKYLEEIEEI